MSWRQQRNIMAFAKSYGYVRFFHPADQAKQEYWSGFAIYGAKQIIDVPDDETLLLKLRELFSPIAPTAKFYTSAKKIKTEIDFKIPRDVASPLTVSWQHKGFNLYGRDDFFKSIRLNRPPLLPEEKRPQPILIASANVSAYQGKKYRLSMRIRNQNKSDDRELSIFYRNALESRPSPEIHTNISAQSLQLERTITSSQEEIAIGMQLLDGLNLDVKDLKLEILDRNKRIPLELNKDVAAENKPLTNTIILSAKDTLAAPLFSRKHHLGDYIDEEMVPGIRCMVPTAVPGDATRTFPLVAEKDIFAFQAAIAQDKAHRSNQAGSFLEVRLGNLVIAWNVLRHSFPYWRDVEHHPDSLFNHSAKAAFKAMDSDGFIKVLKEMTTALNDGHIMIDFFDGSHRPDSLSAPLLFARAGEQVVIKGILDDQLKSKIANGDQVIEINGLGAAQYIENQKKLISGSPQWKDMAALTRLSNGDDKSELQLKLNHHGEDTTIFLKRTRPAVQYRSGKSSDFERKSGWVTSDIYYFDLTRRSFSKEMIDTLKQAKAVIFDMRGYPVDDQVFDIINLLQTKKQKIHLFSFPEILWPNMTNNRYDRAIAVSRPADRHLSIKAYFLTDASAQSASETFLAQIRYFKLGKLIGQPTSGTNGTINVLLMQGKYRMTFSGLFTQNGDGSKHHAIGIVPDIQVEPTVASYQQREDNVLKVAIEEAKNGR
ncbi:hypothetical protein ASE74_10130 [Pedobacter sp. Leaf216]|nr:hypothetical protein ASE74_10130 [Pedobacter sp. Leaf216]